MHLVYADWCGHCVPTALEALRKRAPEDGFELRLHDIDTEGGVADGDALVETYGDGWMKDYLIPQVFVEDATHPPRHVFTGYSEGVRFTRGSLENLDRRGVLRPDWPLPLPVPGRYRSVLDERSIEALVNKGYSGPGSCLHCEEPAQLERLRRFRGLVYAQVCPSRYVTRVVQFSRRANPRAFHARLEPLVKGRIEFALEDVRVATRYDWDRGEESGLPFLFQQTYWNQYYENTRSYRKVRSEDPRRLYLFSCAERAELFLQTPAAPRRRCEQCETRSGSRP